MFDVTPAHAGDKPALYAGLNQQLTALLAGERDFIANAANTAALIWHSLPDLNWAGFYSWWRDAGAGTVSRQAGVRSDSIGPRCVRHGGDTTRNSARAKCALIPRSHRLRRRFNSEIVVPLIKDDRLLGVLDLDSPKPGRFGRIQYQQRLERPSESLLGGTDC